jgi:hypothetical protein
LLSRGLFHGPEENPEAAASFIDLEPAPPQVPDFLLLGKPIAAIDSTSRQKPAARDDR